MHDAIDKILETKLSNFPNFTEPYIDINKLIIVIENSRYSKGGYSVWYYGERETPATISDSIDVTIDQHLLNVPGSRITSKTGLTSIRVHVHVL